MGQQKAAEQLWLEENRKLDVERKQLMQQQHMQQQALEDHWTPWSAASPIYVPAAGEPFQGKMDQKEADVLASTVQTESPEQTCIHGFWKETMVPDDVCTVHDCAHLPSRAGPEVQLPSEPTGQSSGMSDCNGRAGPRFFRGCCAQIVSPPSCQLKPAGQHFSVDLERMHGELLGLRLDKFEKTNYLIVREVLADGLVAQWNANSGQSCRIKAGDCVYGVNGVGGSGDVLLGQLAGDGPLLQLWLWRPKVKMPPDKLDIIR